MRVYEKTRPEVLKKLRAKRAAAEKLARAEAKARSEAETGSSAKPKAPQASQAEAYAEPSPLAREAATNLREV